MNSITRILVAIATIFPALTSVAFAHTGHGDAGDFMHGLTHPFGGLDHVLVMVAVGFYAVLLGGRALWLVPATFVGMMAFGGALGASRFALPLGEIGIATSVIVLGSALALRIALPTLSAIALVGLFAIFHGFAHGAEIPQSASGYQYATGFILATALLHSTGIALGLLADKLSRAGGRRTVQLAGGAMALAGVAFLTSAL
jgi:urease accessory protein